MRKFNSYGPINKRYHYYVDRTTLIESCTEQLIGIPEEGGHYFTIWGPRQTGKTWMIRQSIENIKTAYTDDFIVIEMSMQSFEYSDNDNIHTTFFETWQSLFSRKLKCDIGKINQWQDWPKQFLRDKDLFNKPLILIIDEFDKLPSEIIDRLVSMFRDMYLYRDDYVLHGLALVGVRSVLG
ncbi:MAG: hypothetical protein OMM_14797, partial [Candidatus Magnetoglobus multicellularis str. Araruama]